MGASSLREREFGQSNLLSLKDVFNLDTNVGAQNLFCWRSICILFLQLISMDSLSRWTAIAKTSLPFCPPLSWLRLWRPWIPVRGCLIALSTIITTPVCTPCSTSPSVTAKPVTCQPWVAGKHGRTTLRQKRYNGIMGHLERTTWMGRVWQNQTGKLLK